MKTLYNKGIYMGFLKIYMLSIFILLLSYNVKAQYTSPNVICYGEPIYLFCGGLAGCGGVGSVYTWSDESGAWMSNDLNPVIYPGSPGYHGGQFYLSVQYLPDGLSSGVASAYLLNPFYVSGSVTPVSCNGGNNGSITIVPEGGQPGYGPFNWSNGATTMNISGLTAGIYSVTVTDANYCAVTNSFVVTQPTGMTITKSGGSNVSCYGTSTGSISILVAGGAGSYTYSWSNGGNSATIGNLAAGTYTVTVTDNNLCTKTQSWSITQPSALSSNGNVTNVSCYAGNNGTATIDGVGGTSPYYYKWSTGSVARVISGLSVGRFSVTVTDANNCVASTWLDIAQPSDITIAGTPVNVTCLGINSGKITTTVSGGSGGPNTYLWSNGQTGAAAINLIAGNYTVTVTNGAGCTSNKNFIVGAMTFGPVAIIPVKCYSGNNGSIQLFVSGGVAPYIYSWNNGQNTSTAVNLTAGIYTVTVTDAGSCAKVGSWQVTSPTAISISSVVTNLLCNGNSNGKIDITVNGGTPAYSYKWNVLGYQGQGTPHVSALFAGAYTVTVTDQNSCSKIQSWILAQPVALSSNGFVTGVTCYGGNNGTAALSGFGGTPPYSYKWSTGSTSQRITGLVVGRYYVTVKDANNCVNFTWQTIAQPSDITIAGTPVNVTCQGNSSGRITTTVYGGSGGSMTYLWSNGQTGSTAVNLPVGTYTVTITNSAGCTKSKSFGITENPEITFGPVVVTPAKCYNSNDGSIQLFVTGGMIPYTYRWNNGQTGGTAVNLLSGLYSVTVTDAASCFKVGSWGVIAPSAMSISSTVTNLLCSGSANGKINITVNGGTPAYSYKWNVLATQGQGTPNVYYLNAGTYTVTVSDQNTCVIMQSWVVTQPASLSGGGLAGAVTCYGGNNGIATATGFGGTSPYKYKWSTGSTGQVITALTAGSYFVTITDASSCASYMFHNIVQPSDITITGTPLKLTCQGSNNGQITTTVSGGSGGLTAYRWSNGQTGSTASNLVTGTYTVTVTNLAGCSKAQNFTITENPAITFGSVSVVPASCYNSNNGSIQLFVSGGVSPYTYLWNNGQTTGTAVNLVAGVYTVTVTDAGLCTKIGSWQVFAPSAMSISSTVTNLLCNGNPTGKIDITVSGGTTGYYYNWNVIGSQGKLTPHVFNLFAGTYTVTVTDQNACINIQSWLVTQPVALSGRGVSTQVTCYGGNDGVATATGFGGTSPYKYKWSTGSTGQVVTGLTAAIYYITITDANSCNNYMYHNITQPTDITIIGTPVKVACQGGNTGQITTTVSGGSGGTTTYRWNNGQTGSTAINLAAGTYTVTVTNVAGCSKTQNFTVTENPAITFGSVSVVPVSCNGSNNGSIQLFVSGGVSPYTYLWNNGQITGTAVNLAAGTYSVIVADAGLCTKVGSWLVTQPSALSVAGAVTNVTCYGGSNAIVAVSGFGGTIPYSYKWSTGSTSQVINGLAVGRYTVTMTDANNCILSAYWDIIQPSDIIITGTPVKVNCQGSSTGAITTTIFGGSGGTTTYRWNNGQTGSTAINLAAGTYTVTVTNAAGCGKTQNFTVTENPAITFGSVSVVPVSCNGSNNGSIQLFVSGGVSPYTYLWNNGQITGTAVNLVAGTYSVIVADAGLCTKVGSWLVTQPSALSVAGAVTNVTCYGVTNGIVAVSGFGGTLPYSYKWSTGSTSQVIAGLAAGRYTVTMTDVKNCILFAYWDIVQPSDITITGTPVKVACQGGNTGQITTTVSGGSGGTTTYRWSNGQTNGTAINLIAGVYTVTVTNAAGCGKTQNFTVTENPAITFGSVSVVPVSCNGSNNGSIQLFVSGGVSPYTYLWNNGQITGTAVNLAAGTYSVIVADAGLCTKIGSWLVTQPSALSLAGVVTNVTCYGGANGIIAVSGFGGTIPYSYKWSTGSTSQVIAGLAAGRYTVTMTDANNCLKFAYWEIVQPSDITINGTAIKAICQGSSTGSITTAVTGGSGGTTTYRWNNGQTGSTAINLAAGVYTVTVTNLAGCTKSQSFAVTENPAISFGSVAVVPASCNGSNNGSIQLFASGGVSPYTYLWSNGQTTGTAVNLSAGTYTVTITDVGPCPKVGSWQVTAPSAMSISSTVTNLLCNGNPTGKIDITVSGGTTGYSYNWNVIGVQGKLTPHVFNLYAGTYTVTVTDQNTCVMIQNWLVNQPVALSSSGIATHVSCYGGNNGVATVTGFGGTPPYYYKWSTGSTGQVIAGLAAGLYSVTISDANNCFNFMGQTITQPSEISLAWTAVKVICTGGSNGQITTTISGGSGGATTYIWSNGQTGSTAINLSSGTYTFTVTNSGGCKASSLPIYVGTANLLPGAAGTITGSATVNQGQLGVAYSVAPIANVTGYAWILPPGAAIVSGSNTASITVDFSASASSGNISVSGTNVCGSGTPSPDKLITVIPLSLVLQNITLGAGTYCYNAIQTIYVAGSGSTFVVNVGGIVTMIAGRNIVYLPGTTVKLGGYMRGYITTTGQYCTIPGNPVVQNPIQIGDVQATVPEIVKNQNMRVYPNPINDSFTIELIGATGPGMTKIEIYGMNGVKVFAETLSGEHKRTFTIESMHPGMYFIHVTTGTTMETMKLIKL